MATSSLRLDEADAILKDGYPKKRVIERARMPFAAFMIRLWESDARYRKHGPKVVRSMNDLLSAHPEAVLGGPATPAQKARLKETVKKVQHTLFSRWDEKDEAFFRVVAFYHDIGKYILNERHPKIGWYVVQYIEPEEQRKLHELFNNSQELIQRFLIILRDHDQFGVLSTGEASYPILLHTINSVGGGLEEQKRILGALFLCNIADMAGSFDLDGDTAEVVMDDLAWMLDALEHGWKNRIDIGAHILGEASKIESACGRILRILRTATRGWPKRAGEISDANEIKKCLLHVFGSDHGSSEFAWQLARVCKLDYGKRFFDALAEYCEGPPQPGTGQRKLDSWAPQRIDTESLIYAVLSVLQRITTTYSAMVGGSSAGGNLIGVELKDLTPERAQEKTARIIELLLTSRYPGLTWLMSDAPAWYF